MTGYRAGTRVAGVTQRPEYREPPVPAFLFDLDGTLIDSVYQNVIAWRNALLKLDIDLSVWRIHRRIGMSGGLFVSALLRETGRTLSADDIECLQRDHVAEYLAQVDSVSALPGAPELLTALTASGVPWAIATSGRRAMAERALAMLAAAALLGVDPGHAMVVGDSVWDLLAARRAGALGIGLLSGGYGRAELERAGAYRVYADPADLLLHADEVGLRDVGGAAVQP